jgi:hypothetical protein
MFQTHTAGKARGEKVYRGRQFGETRIDSGNRTDWWLVSKEEEAEFCKITAVLPKKDPPPKDFICPPLLELIIKNEMQREGKAQPGPEFFTFKLNPKKNEQPVS